MRKLHLPAVLAVALLGLGAAPAHAQQWNRTDARGDVTASTSCDAYSQGCTDAVDKAQVDPDVLTVNQAHAARRVKLRAAYADLAATGAHQHVLRIVTNEGLRRRYVVEMNGSRIVFSGLYRERDGAKVACDGIRKSVDYSLNTVSISIPRACLSRPATVRLGFGTLLRVDPADRTKGYWSDDAGLSGLSRHDQDAVLGPSLKRG